MSCSQVQLDSRELPRVSGPTPSWLTCRTFLGILILPQLFCTAAQLSVDVLDETGQSLPCRALARSSDGTCHTPVSAVVLEIGPDRWFYTDGSFELDVPTGELELRVEHGLEFRRYKQRFHIDDQGARKSIVLKRWIDMKQRGYLCADNHLHVDSRSVGAMAISEGLDFASSLTWWDGPDPERPVPPGHGASRILEFSGRKIIASIHDAELEENWGAVYVQNMPHPWPLESDKRRPNLDYLKYAVAQGAIVHYQGGWSREVGLDALLGLVHTVNVCNNNFHMHRFQPRRRYSNLLEVIGFPDYPETEEGMMRMNTETYYRLLNWGLRLAAGAGSATGVKQVPVGYNRAYIKVDPAATLDQFYDTWRAGHNFVTNGPMVLLTGPEGESPGDAISLEKPTDKLGFHVRVFSDQPLQSVEIVQDGKVVKEFSVTDEQEADHRFQIPVLQSGWLAARATAFDDLLSDEELQIYDDDPRQRPSRLRFAHTSPIYLSVNGKPPGVSGSIEEGLLMLDQLESFAKRQAHANRLEDITREITLGRAILNKRLDEKREMSLEPSEQ